MCKGSHMTFVFHSRNVNFSLFSAPCFKRLHIVSPWKVGNVKNSGWLRRHVCISMPLCVSFIHFDHTETSWSCFSVPATQEDFTGALTCLLRNAFDESRKHLNNNACLVTLLASYLQQLAYSSSCQCCQHAIRGYRKCCMADARRLCQMSTPLCHCPTSAYLHLLKAIGLLLHLQICHCCKHCHQRIQVPCCSDWFFMPLANVNTTHMLHARNIPCCLVEISSFGRQFASFQTWRCYQHYQHCRRAQGESALLLILLCGTGFHE